MNTPDNQNTTVGFVNPKSHEYQRLESEMRAGFDYIHKSYHPNFKWKNILLLGSMLTLIGGAETFSQTDRKWYALPVSLVAVAAMGYATKLTDKKDILKLENDMLHKVLDFPLYKKDSAYHSKMMQAIRDSKNPIQAKNDFDNFSDNERAWKRDAKIGCVAIFGINAAVTALCHSVPVTMFCIGTTIAATQGIIYHKHMQNRRLLRATLPPEVQIPQIKSH